MGKQNKPVSVFTSVFPEMEIWRLGFLRLVFQSVYKIGRGSWLALGRKSPFPLLMNLIMSFSAEQEAILVSNLVCFNSCRSA